MSTVSPAVRDTCYCDVNVGVNTECYGVAACSSASCLGGPALKS
jgi:hypothetical protein